MIHFNTSIKLRRISEFFLARKINFSLIAVFICLFFVLITDLRYKNWKQQRTVLFHDVLSYYAYLPSAFVYNDMKLDFLKEDKTRLGDHFWGKKDKNSGNTIIITSYGMSLLYSPFFFAAHLYAKLAGYPANGLSTPYLIALIFSSLAYLALGLFALRSLLSKFFSQTVTALVIMSITLATNMLWYVCFESAMSHVFSFSLIISALAVFNLWIEKQSLKLTIILGLLFGIITLVRPTNIVILLIFLLWKVQTFSDLKLRVLLISKLWKHLILITIIFFIVWLPQFLYWKYLTGSYFFYSYPDNQGFYFQNPQLYNTLFSWRKGLFIYTPVMLFSVIGIFILYKQKRELFFSIFIYFIATWYILSSWWDWWYGGGFGLRPFIDSYGILAFGLAAFFTWIFKRKLIAIKIFAGTLLTASLLIGMWHYKRYRGGSIHWVSMTKEAYFEGFWHTKPTKEFKNKLRKPDYKLARKGIYKYEDEHIENN